MCHILGIEPQFENIIKNGPFSPMTAGQRKPEGQWTGDERKAANLDQRLKSLIMSVLPDDQMNFDFQDSPDDEEDTRSSHEYLNDLEEEEYQARALLVKSKGFFKKDEEEMSSDDSEMVEVKVLMALAEENDDINKEGAKNGEWVKISIRKCISEQIPSQKKRILGADQLIEDPSSSRKKDLDITVESQRNTTDPSVAVTDSLATDYDLADESSVYSTSLPPLKKLDGVEPISGPKTIKSILRSKSTFKAKTLKGVIINEPSSSPPKDNKSSPASKVNSAPAGKLKSVKIKDDPPLAIVIKELNDLKLQISKNQSSYSRNNQPQQCDIKKPIWYMDSVCSRHMTGVKSYLHKYMEQPGSKVVFGDDSPCTTEGYGSIKCNGIFDEKRGTIFNSNKEVIMIALRVRDVYVLDMASSAQESCFFAKASENLN
ncbi:hypothetical protein Tco_0839693 [Tanacetum coccineum]|uniref:Retrovirus-related Pol polyprotein from transposon TNT 1-94-like beta-barrel domain-containing protein n=1 Tax=Tanacetum coccineum TaxID=301880 RepID=A0ABQ5ASJ0_9ASTR